ncbi:hypothetical protein [Parapedobacter sp. 2B3]|uniref:hypothetical protein n=1 Tax=Parapedobacter sp. 2B3 TaxID=3342381 RepID=UPI0035B5B10F
MLAKLNEGRNGTISKRTLDGFLVSVNLVAAANNTVLAATQYGTGTGFDASQVNFKVILRRGGKEFVVMHDNLGILGAFNSILNGGKNWSLGTDIVRPASAAKHHSIRTLFLGLGGHLNLATGDEIYFEVNVGRNSFGSAIDSNQSYVQINPHYSIGKEVGIFVTRSNVIQQSATREAVNLGDAVTRIAFLNMEDTGVSNQIIQNLNFSSDRVDGSFNFAELIALNDIWFRNSQWLKYFDYASGGSDVDSYQPAYPQSFVFHNEEAVDNCSVDITFDPSKVNAQKNYIVYQSFLSSKEIIAKAAAMSEKHAAENISKLPVTL